jgi:CRP-like cAMP-binding protein
MSAADSLRELRELVFFQGLSDAYLQQISAVAERVCYAEGKLLFREGDLALDAHLVLRGNVSLEICAPGVGCRRILTIGRGEIVGWSPLLGQERFTATARTLVATELLKMRGSQLLAMCELDPRFGYEFTQRVAMTLVKRLNATRMQLLDVYGSAMPHESDNSL